MRPVVPQPAPPPARHRDGVFTLAEAAAHGVSWHRRRSLLRAGWWTVVAGTTVVAETTVVERGLSPLARLWAAHLATGGVASHLTAVAWYGLTVPDQMHVIVDRRVHVATPGVIDHRLRLSASEVRWSDGRPLRVLARRPPSPAVPLTAPDRTVVDCLAWLPLPEATTLAFAAVQQRVVTVEALQGAVSRQPRRLGMPQVRALLQDLSSGAHSAGERRLHVLLDEAGLPGWRANVPIRHGGRLVAVADVLFEAERLVIEFDGRAFHEGDPRFQRDRRRDRLLVALGYTVLRVTWEDVTQRPREVAAQVAQVLARLRSA